MMTEAEWLYCLDPPKMVDFVIERNWGSDRKYRLFHCACVRRVWHLLANERYRLAIELTEQEADGLLTEEYLRDTVGLAWIAEDPTFGSGGDAEVAVLAATGVWESWDWVDALERAVCAATGVGIYDVNAANPNAAGELQAQTDLLRCIMGNPFRSLPRHPLPLRGWNEGIIVKMAKEMYDTRRFENLPILADALEDSGCTGEDLLGHFREDKSHARGCWGVDILLGKE